MFISSFLEYAIYVSSFIGVIIAFLNFLHICQHPGANVYCAYITRHNS